MSGGVKAVLVVAAVAGLSLALAGPGWAQGRGARIRPAGGGTHVRLTGPAATSFRPNSAAVPGLGFDYVHLAAVGGHSDASFLRRPVRNQFITPIFSGIVPFYDVADESSYTGSQPSVVVVQQPPQTIVVQQPIVQQPTPQDPIDPPSASADPAPVPLPDLGEYVFLRRDGQVVFAVAFTTSNDCLIYITREGVRRSFPVSELDKDATVQMNDANGTALVLPN